jgi:hypothetical protein
VTTEQLRDRIALGLALCALLAGVASAALGAYHTGIHWRVEDDRLVVDYVDPLSQADRDGVRPFQIALELNGRQLISLPAYQYGEVPADAPDGVPPVVGTAPPVPTSIAGTIELMRLATQPVEWVTLISPEALASGGPDAWQFNGFNYPGTWNFRQGQLALLPGMLILVAGLRWLRSARVGTALRGLAIPLVTAVAIPLLVSPLEGIGTFWAILTARGLMILGVLPLAAGLVTLIPSLDDRRLMIFGIAAMALGAATPWANAVRRSASSCGP